MLNILRVIIARDLLLAFRRRADVFNTLAFFVIVTTMFPLGIGPESQILRSIAPGVVWVSALLANLLSLPRLFAADHADGTLEQMVLSPGPLALLAFGKTIAHWLATGLPIVILGPAVSLQFGLDASEIAVLAATLALGTPILCFLGAIGAALTLGARGGGVLLALLVLPLFIPILIFGAGAVGAFSNGLGAAAHLWLLAAGLVVAAFFAPFACASALRVALD